MFDDKEARQDIEELQQQLDDTNRQIAQLNDQIQQMQQDLNEMQQSILTVKKEEEQLAQHLRDNFDNRERSLRASMRSIRDRQSQLENKVENEYQPQLEREQQLMEQLKDSIGYIRGRLASYQRLREKIDNIFNDIDDLSALKLLTEDEYEHLMNEDNSGPDLEALGSLLERRFDRIEEKFENASRQDVGEDLRLVVQELEDQGDRMDKLGEAYQELGEMMRLVLEELRSKPSN